MPNANKYIGSSLDELLEADGTLAEATAVALDRLQKFRLGDIAADCSPEAETLNCDCGGILKAHTAATLDFSPWVGFPVTLEDAPCKRCTVCGQETLQGETIEAVFSALTRRLLGQADSLSPAQLRYLRKEIDLSRDELAHRLQVSAAAVLGWESGRALISPEVDQRLRGLVTASQAGLQPSAPKAGPKCQQR